MGISKIGSLFASSVDSVYGSSQSKPTQTAQQQPATKANPLGTDAVVFSRSMRPPQAAPTSSEDVRASRVQSLKKEVEKGGYRPDSEKVAVAVLKELS